MVVPYKGIAQRLLPICGRKRLNSNRDDSISQVRLDTIY